MQWSHVIVRYGELFLKGKNRGDFEKRLVKNIKDITAQSEVRLCPGRVFIPFWLNHSTVRRVFGITSYSPALRVEKNMNAIFAAVDKIVREQNFITLVGAHRSDKNFELTSPEITKAVAGYLHATFPTYEFREDQTMTIEIHGLGAYLYNEKVPCFGGLPTGCDGQVMALIDSPQSVLSSLLCMKRGMNVIPVTFGEIDISLLQQFSSIPIRLHQVKNWDEVDELAQKMKIQAITCGQTFESFSHLKTTLLPLRPLIAYSSEKIKNDFEMYRQAAF